MKSSRNIWAVGLAVALLGSGATSSQAQDWNLRVAVPDSGINMDPAFAVAPRSLAQVMNTYAHFMTYELRDIGNGVRARDPARAIGHAFESMTPNADFTVWTIKIRPGLKFADGTPVTTAALQYTFDRTFKLANSGAAFIYGKVAHIEGPQSLKIVDDMTATLTTKLPMEILPQLFAISNSGFINPKLGERDSADPLGTEFLKLNAMGGGAYTVQSYTPNQIVLAKNNNYFASPDRATTVTQQVVPASANRLAFLQRGVVDVAIGLSPEEVEALEGQKDVKVIATSNTNQISLAFNASTAPFDDKRVRKAISLVIPYDQILRVAYRGYAEVGGGPIPIGVPAHDPQFSKTATDVEQAKRLLAETNLKDGGQLNLELVDDPSQEKVAVLVQQALRQLKLDVTIVKLAPNVYSERRSKRAMPMYIKWQNYAASDPHYVLSLGYTCGAFFNYTSYCNKEVDAMVNAAINEQDRQKRFAMYRDIQARIVDDQPVAWIAQPKYTLGVRSNIDGYADFTDQHVRFEYFKKRP